ncbi:hypothetical protein FAGAP_5877 [Fusarium agapanthi]|uniref:Uncharacterized protein n=1 Tax=Fusarium agapanthi TaxID=1803897 RepID=A0A9P5B8G9_9HYPO|nr:hypothetical protein FAGAP_5877 [Fusarium agapanthi]
MASLNHIATVFAEYKYDEDLGFKDVNGVPCLYCVSKIDFDVSCICVCGSTADSCVLCDHYENQCGGPMPRQVLGVAQWYWNFVKALATRDVHGEVRPVVKPCLTRRQFWRLTVALKACGAAWREIERHLVDPNNFAIVALQELTSAREIATLSALQSAGAISSLDEFRYRIAATQPAYTRDDNCVVALRDALARLPVAENTVVPFVPEQECESLPDGFPSDLLDAMLDESDSPAPRPVVFRNGIPNSLSRN